jgi:hypothetical protein
LPPRSGLERSDFVHWPKAAIADILGVAEHYVLVSKLDKAQPASTVRRARILKRSRGVVKRPTAERAAIPDRQHRCRRQAQ